MADKLFKLTNKDLAKSWKNQDIDHLPTLTLKNKPYILFKMDLTEKMARDTVKSLNKEGLKAESMKNEITRGYDVWLSMRR